MLFLIFLGALCGPILGIFDPVAVKSFAPFLAALALAYILFDGGMGLNIGKVVRNSPKAVMLAILGFVSSVIGVCVFMVYVFNVPLVYGLLFGSMFGGSSSVAVISLTSKIKIGDKGSIILILESAITDILCVVLSLSLIDVLVTGQADVVVIGLGIAEKFIIGGLIGVGLSLAWLFALRKVGSMPFSYILTLGIVLFGYAASESLGGSGALSALLFGLILGNEVGVLRFFKLNGNETTIGPFSLAVSEGLKRFEAEIAFLIRTFFFVFLGIIASFSSLTMVVSGVVISFILLATRYGAVWLVTRNSALEIDNKIMTVILTRGLAAAVLATLPAQYGLAYSGLFVDIAVVVIVSTAIIATVGSMYLAHQKTPTPIFPPPQDSTASSPTKPVHLQ
jgi:cell volume regulation protein A